MEQNNIITLTTSMQFSEERLEEIFAVPKTKELFEKFVSQEEKRIAELTQRLQEIAEKIEELDNNIPRNVIQKKLKVFILADSLQSVINGKSINQAIQEKIRKNLKKPEILEKVEEEFRETFFGTIFLLKLLESDMNS